MTDPATDLAAAKAGARISTRARRKALPSLERSAASVLICAHIIASAAFRKADLLLTYVPVGSEVDVSRVALAARDDRRKMAIPRTDGHVLSFDEVHSAALDTLEPGAFGIPSAVHPSPIHPTPQTLVLVPLLAFDRVGNRLGSGKGFYDRFLARFPGVALGVAFAAQEIEAVPTEPHDRRLDGVVTEAGLRLFGPPSN